MRLNGLSWAGLGAVGWMRELACSRFAIITFVASFESSTATLSTVSAIAAFGIWVRNIFAHGVGPCVIVRRSCSQQIRGEPQRWCR